MIFYKKNSINTQGDMVVSCEGLPSEEWYKRFIQYPEMGPLDSEEHSDIDEPLDSEDFFPPKYRRRNNLSKTLRKSYPRLCSNLYDHEEVCRYIKNAFFDTDPYDENRIEETERHLKEFWEQYERCLAASTIQKYWRECRYNPSYKMCQKVLFRNLDIISTEKK